MKAHTLAKKLLKMPNVEVYIPKHRKNCVLDKVAQVSLGGGSIKPLNGKEFTEKDFTENQEYSLFLREESYDESIGMVFIHPYTGRKSNSSVK